MHFNPTHLQFLIGAVSLMLVIVLAIAVIVKRRNRDRAPFRNYFCTQYDRELSRQGYCSNREE